MNKASTTSSKRALAARRPGPLGSGSLSPGSSFAVLARPADQAPHAPGQPVYSGWLLKPLPACAAQMTADVIQ
ncbi:hypothetical protein PSm6_14240 [Pseudomonas solani]|uniref:Uncharacterized protein n=1 Tax=Pseudomonas solani TaxID=2731552 RepID=A0ABN6BM64_9PSED|nr:hypothetical protein PSm6_14240 [Pseudomonas solani]